MAWVSARGGRRPELTLRLLGLGLRRAASGRHCAGQHTECREQDASAAADSKQRGAIH
jgi:hypothetical protein